MVKILDHRHRWKYRAQSGDYPLWYGLTSLYYRCFNSQFSHDGVQTAPAVTAATCDQLHWLTEQLSTLLAAQHLNFNRFHLSGLVIQGSLTDIIASSWITSNTGRSHYAPALQDQSAIIYLTSIIFNKYNTHLHSPYNNEEICKMSPIFPGCSWHRSLYK